MTTHVDITDEIASYSICQILEQLDRGSFEFVLGDCLTIRLQVTPGQLRQIQLQGHIQTLKQVVAALHPTVEEIEYVAPGFRPLRTGIVRTALYLGVDRICIGRKNG